jgi:putative tryptophan/tyrosine transport system substrate-binding protein
MRLFFMGLVAVAMFAGQGALARDAAGVYRLGILSPAAGPVQVIRGIALPELTRLGFVEGKNLTVEARVGLTEELPTVARDLASTHPEVIIAVGAAAIRAIRDGGDRTPIVGAFIGEDPIAAGFAASLAHPGGTVTGIVMLAPELDSKRLHFLHEAFPDRRRIAALAVNEQRDAPNILAVKDAARHAGVDLLSFYAARPADYAPAFAAMLSARADGLQITSAPELFASAPGLAALAIENKLPTICEWAEMAQSGCLFGYGPDFSELERRVANFVALIFRGTGPGELPIEGPTHFKFVINLKTAKAIGLTIPPSVSALADEVIE